MQQQQQSSLLESEATVHNPNVTVENCAIRSSFAFAVRVERDPSPAHDQTIPVQDGEFATKTEVRRAYASSIFDVANMCFLLCSSDDLARTIRMPNSSTLCHQKRMSRLAVPWLISRVRHLCCPFLHVSAPSVTHYRRRAMSRRIYL
jgi:hypothetical protein